MDNENYLHIDTNLMHIAVPNHCLIHKLPFTLDVTVPDNIVKEVTLVSASQQSSTSDATVGLGYNMRGGERGDDCLHYVILWDSHSI